MEKIGYKVVRVARNGAMMPATKISNQGFRYRIGVTTRINPSIHGPIGVFSTLEAAREFKCRENHDFKGWIAMEVLKVVYVESREEGFWKKVWSWKRWAGSATTRKERGIGYINYWGFDVPSYTKYASEVTPLEVL